MVNMFVNFLSTEADWGVIIVVDSNAEPVFEGGSEVFVVESVFGIGEWSGDKGLGHVWE